MNFGLIGYGAIGAIRAAALAKTPGARLTMIAELSEENRKSAAALAGVRVTASIDELVASSEVDAVIVSTPPNIHRGHCEAALRAGKHVLCEKPLASTIQDCEAIVETARQGNRTLATGFNYRFYPAVAKARELIRAGAIGEISHVSGYAGHPGGPEFTHAWVHDPSIMGGGALMDNGIHLADLTLHFLGRPVDQSGFSSERVWNFRGSEDDGFVLMRTAEGRIGTLHASWIEWRGYRLYVDIYGSQGCIRASYPPMMTVLHRRPVGAAKRGKRKIFLFPMFQVIERLRSYRWTIVRSFIAEHVDFMERIADRPGVGATGEDGLLAVKAAQSVSK